LDAIELEKEQESLKNRLREGEISKEEYWEGINSLERLVEGYEYQKKEFLTGVGRSVIKTFLFLLPILTAGLILYFLFFHYPIPSEINIKVSGGGILPATSTEKAEIYKGLELIKEYSSEDYIFIDTYVDRVEVSGPAGISFFGKIRGYYRGGSEGFGKTIRIVRDFKCPAHCNPGDWSGSNLLIAEFIIHEACHSMQYHTSQPYSEAECYRMQFEFAEKVGPILWRDFQSEFFIFDPSGTPLNF
jgi:hypothetical protein